MSTYDVIVVGVGAMGAATCWHLARRGMSVLGLDQHAVPNALGSSHGHTRLIRLAYYEHPDYVPLLRRAYELWGELENDCGIKLLHETGGLYMGSPESEFLNASVRAAQAHDLPHDVLDRAAIAERYPQFAVPPHYVGLFEPRGGFLLVEQAVSAFVDRAMRAGAEIHGHEAVRDLAAGDDGVMVRTDIGTYEADHLVVAGGAWSDRLVGGLGVELSVTRQVNGWVWPEDPAPFDLGTFPCWAIDRPDGTQDYGFPIVPGCPGLKVAHHYRGRLTTPETISRGVEPDDELDFRPTVSAYLPGADGPLLGLRVCMYTNSPDSHFIVGHHPHQERVVVACGFSGHGFKFASVMGEALADLAVNGETALPIEFLSPDRFDEFGEFDDDDDE